MSQYERVPAPESLRSLVNQHLEVVETNRAEGDLIALSFQSKHHPERHVSIYFFDPDYSIDLEDWTVDDVWDHAVERLNTSSLDEAFKIIQNWLD